MPKFKSFAAVILAALVLFSAKSLFNAQPTGAQPTELPSVSIRELHRGVPGPLPTVVADLS